MKLLLLGSGGREHALAWKIAQSPKVEKLYIAPGNAGTSSVGENVNIKATDFDALKAFALTALKQSISPLSGLLPKVPVWKAVKNLPKNLCNAITFRPHGTRVSQPIPWKKDLLFWKVWKHPMY